MRIAREGAGAAPPVSLPEIPGFTRLRYLPRDAFYCGGELVPLVDEKDNIRRDLLDRACADQIVPYPPGIPVLRPGAGHHRKSSTIWSVCCAPRSASSFTGSCTTGNLPCLRVLRPAEERGCAGSVRRSTDPLIRPCNLKNGYVIQAISEEIMLPSFNTTKFGFRIRTRQGLVVEHLMIHGHDEADAERKLRRCTFTARSWTAVSCSPR